MLAIDPRDVLQMKRFFFLIVITLSISFIFPLTVQAVDYDIEKLRIEAEIKPNGVVHVYESYTYNFKSSFKGMTRTVYPKKGSFIDNFMAFENVNQLDVELKDHTFFIHRKGQANEVVTINVFYIIHQGLEIYEDVAQFYWPFIDDRNESDFGDLKIIIYPPENTELLDVLGYDEAKDTEELLTDGSVKFSLGEVKAERNADIRLLYDASSFSPLSLTGEGPRKESLMEEIEKDRKNQEAREKRRLRLKKFGNIFFPLLAGLMGAMFFINWLKSRFLLKGFERNFSPDHFLPDEKLSLAATLTFVSELKYGYSQLLTVTFFDLIRRGYIRQIDKESFALVSRDTPYEQEVFFLDWLFERLGKQGEIQIDQLESYVEDEERAIEFQQDLTKWRKLLDLELSRYGVRREISLPRILAMFLEFFLTIFIVLFVLHDLLGHMGLAFVFSFISTIILIFYKPKTAKGINLQLEWDQFVQKYLEEGDLYLSRLPEDERARAYLYSFALSYEELEETNEQQVKSFPNRKVKELDPSYYFIFTKEIRQHFQTSFTRSRPHYLYSSKSRARGGGVGGGGGGAGAF